MNALQNLAMTLEEKQSVSSLFNRAVEDYVSVDVWLEFCQWKMTMLGELITLN